MPEDYCELCDLRFSQCVHGAPKPPPPAEPVAPVKRTRAAAKRVPGTPLEPAVRQAPRKWTSPDELKAPIVALLQQAGGQLPADEVLAALEEQLGDALRPGDREPMPQGELRWQYAARRARRALQDEGVLAEGTPGVWRLSPAAS